MPSPSGFQVRISYGIGVLDTFCFSSACATEPHRFEHPSSLVTGRPSTCHEIRVKNTRMSAYFFAFWMKSTRRTWYLMLISLARSSLTKKLPQTPQQPPTNHPSKHHHRSPDNARTAQSTQLSRAHFEASGSWLTPLPPFLDFQIFSACIRLLTPKEDFAKGIIWIPINISFFRCRTVSTYVHSFGTYLRT